MKRPFFIVAFLFCVGILLGDCLQPPLGILFIVGLGVGVAGLVFARARAVLLCLLLVLAGWINQIRTTVILSPVDLRLLVSTNAEIATLRGILKAPPVERIFESRNRESRRSLARVETEALSRNGQWEPATGEVAVSIAGVLDAGYHSGQRVEIDGVISPPHGPRAPGLFDNENYLLREGVYFQFTTRTNDWRILPQTPAVSPSRTERFHAWAKKTLALGLPEEDLPQRLLWTLMLDWKAPMTANVAEPFVRAGTFHVFAVDGLRMGLIAGILLLVLRTLQVPRAINGIVVIAALWFYTSLTGFPASAVRASIMMSVILLGWTLKRPGDVLNSLFAAAFLILAWNPQQLFQAGFQLSFLVVLCIALILAPAPRGAVLQTTTTPPAPQPPPIWNRFKSKCESWLGGDPLLPTQYQAPWHAWVLGGLHRLWQTTELSWAAWVGSIPLAACYFHIFNPVSIPANILVVPLTVLALASSLGSLAAGALCWTTGAILFNHTSWLLMSWITGISQWFAQWPLCWNVAAPTPLVLLTVYVLILTLVSGWAFRTPLKRWVIAIDLGLILLCGAQWAWHRHETRLYILPADGGHVIFVNSHNSGESLLVNCGNTSPAERLVKPFLQAQGVNALPRFCISHASARNMGGFLTLRTHFALREILVSPNKPRSVVYRKLSDDLEKSGQLRKVAPGDVFGAWTILHPPLASRLARTDENSVVLQGNIHGQTILLLSDLDVESQTALANGRPDLRADIVITGLPTSPDPPSSALLDTLKPKLILVADGEFPATRRAPAAFRQSLLRRGIPVLFCRDTGALTFTFTDSRWALRDTDGRLIMDDRLNWNPPAPEPLDPPQDDENAPPADSE